MQKIVQSQETRVQWIMNETVWDFLNKEVCSKAKQSPIRSGLDKLKQAKFSKQAIIGQNTTKKNRPT